MKLMRVTSMQIVHFTLLGIGLIVATSLTFIMLEWATLGLTMEIATLLIGVLVSLACLLYIYQDHRKGYITERRLKKRVIGKIYALYAPLSYAKWIHVRLEKKLEAQSLAMRLKKLNRYDKNTEALKAFACRKDNSL
jgi:hypothetical protein